MIIKESAENYLEAILMLKNKNGYVRSIDVAHNLNFTKQSVFVKKAMLPLIPTEISPLPTKVWRLLKKSMNVTRLLLRLLSPSVSMKKLRMMTVVK